MRERQSVFVTISLDVEEEGLFRRSYNCLNPSIRNTGDLWRLAPLLERGVRPTLFCAHAAFADAPSRKRLEQLRDKHGAAIAAHLHHWNTPPLAPGADGRVPAHIGDAAARKVDKKYLAEKFRNLFRLACDFQGEDVTCFRMGRWDLLHDHWRFLEENGVKCDASVRPLHMDAQGPDHFGAPNYPYIAAQSGIMEIPLTVAPLHPALVGGWLTENEIWGNFPQKTLKNWGALALLPVEHPLWLMKLTTKLYLGRGGKNLSFTWHSSEMMPGGSPRLPDEKSVRGFMKKMTAFVDWLQNNYRATFVTMPELRDLMPGSLPMPRPSRAADWTALKGS